MTCDAIEVRSDLPVKIRLAPAFGEIVGRLRHCFAGSAGRMRTLVTLVRHLEVPISLVGRARRTRRTARRLVLVDDRSGDVSR